MSHILTARSYIILSLLVEINILQHTFCPTQVEMEPIYVKVQMIRTLIIGSIDVYNCQWLTFYL